MVRRYFKVRPVATHEILAIYTVIVVVAEVEGHIRDTVRTWTACAFGGAEVLVDNLMSHALEVLHVTDNT